MILLRTASCRSQQCRPRWLQKRLQWLRFNWLKTPTRSRSRLFKSLHLWTRARRGKVMNLTTVTMRTGAM
ncbi:hypothetical protein L914_11235 [Phytophthora nicotianae]|uniref:Uncharacterized protein n=1 Tax=Phytophthora nicotianae TaxID=4792 RepID=W2N3M8_PHYNI|nr:hypothetical protein L914_11235 [Phytophthora nicotianae]